MFAIIYFLDERSDDEIGNHTMPQDLSQEFAEETSDYPQVGSFIKYNKST